ncbi:MAG: hypothetical protein ABSG15_02280 [FCB group bacterium]|jgi:hypothetical protein
MLKAPQKTKQYEELEKKFRNQVELDKLNPKFKLKDSFYIPNPYISENPKYCIIALEPNLGALNFLKRIEFLSSFRNFLLHYCTYTFLCGNNFDYHFTDISKSAMESKDANSVGIRKEVYKNWFPLLKEELQVLSGDSQENQPKIISIGATVKNFLEKSDSGFEISHNILHYGNNNDGRFKKQFEEQFKMQTIDFDSLFIKVTEFAIFLMKYLDFTAEEINDRFKADFGIFDGNKFSEKQKEQLIYRYLYYKSEFEKIAETGIKIYNL